MAGFNRKSLIEAYQRGFRDFRGIHLSHVVLGESLSSAGTHKALDLHSCDFSGAIMKGCSFVGADLSSSIFKNADLSDSNFARANLAGCNFNQADLSFCNLNLADCSSAKFTDAELGKAEMWGADFSHTLLTGAVFYNTILKSVRLTGARATRLTLEGTLLSNLDLSVFVNARIIRKGHFEKEASTIDWSAIARSLHLPHDRLKQFLVKVSMPESVANRMIEAAQYLDPKYLSTTMQSTFISYGTPDEKFAITLRNELQKNGVTTFLFRYDAIPGQKLHHMMRDGVNNYERVVLICSEASLDRPGVLNEIEETLQREARDGGMSYLIPIRLDDYVFSGWNPPDKGIAQAVRDRVIGDFRIAKRNKKALAGAIRPLLKALEKKLKKAY
jgi:hypothetical protein